MGKTDGYVGPTLVGGHEIRMLTLYDKSERSTIPGHTLKQIADAIKHEKA